jgi:F-type H+-transporting ATPase subunit b
MKRLAWLILLVGLSAPFTFAQQEPSEPAHTEETEGEGGLAVWAWLNFAILVAALVYGFRKGVTPYLATRALRIKRDMVEAGDVRADAEKRMAEVNARLAHLAADTAALRREALGEETSESERVRRETAAELAKIQLHAEQEIAAAGKAARLELKRYSAQLAVALAEQKIRARMTPEIQDALVGGFVRNLERADSRAPST